jgi:hypothetical protein
MGPGVTRPEVLGPGSLFQVPSLEMLMGSMAGGSGPGIGDHVLVDPNDLYESPSIEALGTLH